MVIVRTRQQTLNVLTMIIILITSAQGLQMNLIHVLLLHTNIVSKMPTTYLMLHQSCIKLIVHW